MNSYELWTHRWTHAFYAVRLSEGRVTGVCGPLPFATLGARGDLAGYAYNDRPEAIEEALRHPEQFGLAEAWRRGRAEGSRLPRWSRPGTASGTAPSTR
jgi:hypothetical protein